MTGQSHTLEGWEPLSAEQLTYDVAQAWVRNSWATCSQCSVSAELAREPHQCCGTGVRGGERAALHTPGLGQEGTLTLSTISLTVAASDSK